ncbi:YdaS family helix-turn-helix protein [Marinobacter sp. DS40M6]|uniref:YdaS family helix-turn-helix protein n=1 Tax=Marinobacter sp. DS40M6 TaxID=1597776 RepID=UPI0023703C58|nr:helix-turn-helix domain-containing protein [Marinobacter sp. DS40M6]
MHLNTIFEKLKAHPNIKTKRKVAEICGISPPALNYWKRVPSEHCIELERASDGAVTRYQMRPDVFGVAPDHSKENSVA